MTAVPDLDVLVLGEVLVELSSPTALAAGATLTLGVSGDVVNAAASAAAAGAHTALLTRIADDELGDVIEARLAALGIDTGLVRRIPGQQAAYFVHADPAGEREFIYLRRCSAASGLHPDDVPAADVEDAGIVLSTGITCSISDSAQAAVVEAAQRAHTFVYDPDHRPRLATPDEDAATLRLLAPYTALVTPACPGETQELLGTDDALVAARRLRDLGAAAVAVTRGSGDIIVDDGDCVWQVPAVAAPTVVDQTGAGDSLSGTVAARLALGDPLLEAVRLGAAAASLSIGGRGGNGRVPSLTQSREHRDRNGSPARSLSGPPMEISEP